MAAVRHLGLVWTTCGEYSMVSITVQNVVMMYTVVLIIRIFQYLAHLAKRSLHALKIGVLGLFDPINGLNINKSQKARHCGLSCR